MSDAHGDELLAAIRAAPDDRALRLVYADWLMERGDPRGEWIALSCGQDTEDTDREMRRRALWQHYGRQWESEDRGESGLQRISYRDGIPDYARVGPDTDLGSPQLARYPIRTLAVLAVPGLLGALAKSPLLETVRHVRLYSEHARIGDDELVTFLDAPALARLEGIKAQIGDNGRVVWPALARCSRLAALTQLEIDGPLSVEMAHWQARSCPALEEIGYDFPEEGALAVLAASAKFRLRSLRVDDSDEPSDSIAFVLASPMAAELTDLSLHVSVSDDQTAAVLARLPCAASLRRLSMDASRGSPGLRGLRDARFPALETLRAFNIDAAGDLVDALPRLPTITALELSGFEFEVTRAHVERIMSSLPRLQRLELSGVRDDATRAIAGSEQARALRHLSLQGEDLPYSAIADLVRSGRLNELRELALKSRELTRRAAREVAEGPFDHMARLSLYPTPGEDIAALFAHAWLPCADAGTYERKLELSGRATERKER